MMKLTLLASLLAAVSAFTNAPLKTAVSTRKMDVIVTVISCNVGI
jgi:hypothetical protein